MDSPDSNLKNKNKDNEAPPPVRSKNSTRHSHVRFVNMTCRRVDVIWINYEGVRVKYRTLEPKDYFDVTSFVTHPWIFLDSETHNKLVVSSKEVFDIPEPVYVRGKEGAPQPTRAYVKITLPVYSLKECSLQMIQKCLKNPKDAFELEIPTLLQRDLHQRCCLTFGTRPRQ